MKKKTLTRCQNRLKRLNACKNLALSDWNAEWKLTIYPSKLNHLEVKTERDRSRDQFVLVPVDKAWNNIVFVFKALYIKCILEELGFNLAGSNSTYTHSSFSKYDILQIHKSVLNIFNIPNNQNEFQLPYSYWIPELPKCLQTKMHSEFQ